MSQCTQLLYWSLFFFMVMESLRVQNLDDQPVYNAVIYMVFLKNGKLILHKKWLFSMLFHSNDNHRERDRATTLTIPTIESSRILFLIINWVVRALNADWLTAVVYLSSNARGGVVYGQYTTAKDCSYAWRNTECLDTALSHGIPEVPYCCYEQVSNVIRAVKINILSYPWYTVCYKLGGSSPECWLADSGGISDCISWVWQNIYFYCSNYVGNQFRIAIRHLGGFWYMASIPQLKALCVASSIRTTLSRGILAIYHTHAKA